MPGGLKDIVKLIDSYVDGGAVEHGNAAYVNGMIREQDHEDNGSGSTLHPLTAIHHSDGANPHYTLQAGWLQTLCLRHMSMIDDSSLQIMASAATTATRKSEVKAAQDQAYGKTIQAIDNLHFYAAGSTVATGDVTLATAMGKVRAALQNMGETGRVILLKDDAFLAGHAGYGTYRIKSLEATAWQRLATLLDSSATSTAAFARRGDKTRQLTARMLLDALTRAGAPTGA